MIFPVLLPRPPEIVDVTGIGRNKLSRLAVWSVHDRTLDATFDERESGVRIVQAGPELPRCNRMQRPDESLGIIECRFNGNDFSVGARLKNLDNFQIVAVFEHRMRQSPSLNIRCPGHQRVAVPESDGLAIPLRDLLYMFPPDKNTTQKVVRNA